MRCPKCGWQTECIAKYVYARKQDGTPIMIKLVHCNCLRKGCNWSYEEKYEDKIRELGLKPWR